MKLQTIIVLILALVMGGAAVFAIAPSLQSKTEVKEEMSPVVLAVSDISRGTVIQTEMLKLDSTPKRLLNANSVTKLEDAVGRVASIPMLAGEQLHNMKITTKGSGGGLAALIPKGMRAFTIQTLNVASGVAGFVLPGNKVDVLLTFNEMSGRNQPGGGTVTLLQNLEILAVDQKVDREPTEKSAGTKELRSVTLLVTPDQAKRLDLAQNLGNLHLALRNPEDVTNTASNEVITVEQLNLLRPMPPQPPPPIAVKPSTPPPAIKEEPPAKKVPVPYHIRTIRGTQEGIVQVYQAGR